MEIAELARVVAITAHDAVKQERNFTGGPYWRHPEAVANKINALTNADDQELVAAGWLHDVVEDTGVTIEFITEMFGPDVAQYVGDVTKQNPYGEDDSRNALFEIKRLMTLSSKSQLLKLCDIYCNIKDIRPECGFLFVSEWLPKKIAAVLAIKFTTTEHDEFCDEIIGMARAVVKVHFPNTSVMRLYTNGVNLLGKAMNLVPEEESVNG